MNAKRIREIDPQNDLPRMAARRYIGKVSCYRLYLKEDLLVRTTLPLLFSR